MLVCRSLLFHSFLIHIIYLVFASNQDPFTYSTVISISVLESQIIFYSFPLILFLSPRNSGQCEEISISLPFHRWSSANSNVRTRNCFRAQIFDVAARAVFPHSGAFFCFVFFLPSSARSQEPGKFSPIYFCREREPETCVAFEYVDEFLSMARCGSSRLTDKIAISREGRKAIARHRFVIFRAYFCEKRNNWHRDYRLRLGNYIDKPRPLLDKQDILDLREREKKTFNIFL